MARARIFEYAVIHHPKPKKKDEPAEKSVLIVDVERVLAVEPQEVTILASRQIPEDYLDKLEQIEIAVRPF